MREKNLVAPAEPVASGEVSAQPLAGIGLRDHFFKALFFSPPPPADCGPSRDWRDLQGNRANTHSKKPRTFPTHYPHLAYRRPSPWCAHRQRRETAQRHAHAYPSWSRSCVVSFGPRGVLLAHHEDGECLHNEDERLCARVLPPLCSRAASARDQDVGCGIA